MLPARNGPSYSSHAPRTRSLDHVRFSQGIHNDTWSCDRRRRTASAYPSMSLIGIFPCRQSLEEGHLIHAKCFREFTTTQPPPLAMHRFLTSRKLFSPLSPPHGRHSISACRMHVRPHKVEKAGGELRTCTKECVLANELLPFRILTGAGLLTWCLGTVHAAHNMQN
jgi:hypothetical protein